jgi:hypothetical protein
VFVDSPFCSSRVIWARATVAKKSGEYIIIRNIVLLYEIWYYPLLWRLIKKELIKK